MSLGRRRIFGFRMGAGSFVNGVWVEGTLTPIAFDASVQALRPKEMQMLPEGRIVSQGYRLYTDYELKTVDTGVAKNPDRVTLFGLEFEVFSVEPWQSGIIPHYKAVVVR
jgi:hypothetical protein